VAQDPKTFGLTRSKLKKSQTKWLLLFPKVPGDELRLVLDQAYESTLWGNNWIKKQKKTKVLLLSDQHLEGVNCEEAFL